MFSKVAAEDPTDGYALYYTGQCEFQLGRVESALAWYEQAIRRDPYLRSGYYGAFQACLRLGETERANGFRQDFERLDGNPQARLAETKYTRMGPKAELQAINARDHRAGGSTGRRVVCGRPPDSDHRPGSGSLDG